MADEIRESYSEVIYQCNWDRLSLLERERIDKMIERRAMEKLKENE